MLLGLTEPTSGEARVMGLDPEREPRLVKRRVGYLPDAVGFYGGLTGRQNLRYTANLNGLRKAAAESAMVDVLEQVGLTDRADDKVDTYSRGMRQRLGIADALVKSPDLLILDEPTTAIDPLGVVEILELLRRLVDERGLAIMLSSHLLTQVQSVCDRIGIFAAGRLVGQGTVDELATTFGDGTATIEVGLELAEGANEVDRAGDRPPRAVGRDRRDPARPCRDSLAGGRAAARGGRRGAPGDPGGSRRAPSSLDHAPPGRPVARRHLPRGGHEDRRVSAASTTAAGNAATEATTPAAPVALPGAGWRVVAAKELGDHLLSVRFVVLLIVLGLAAAIPLYFAADQIRSLAPQASGAAAVFLALFTFTVDQLQGQSVFTFIGVVAPLLGLAFAFDAVNGERSEGTLPRLLAQPIHRDDVINGKFVAGLAVIGLVLTSVVMFIAGFGMLRLGIVPHSSGGAPARGLGRGDLPVRRALARLRPAPVGARPARGHGRPDRVRRLAAGHDLRAADHQFPWQPAWLPRRMPRPSRS